MHKLVFAILMAVVWWMLHALQMDEELAMNTVYEAKRALNRAAHASAQQVDREMLEEGKVAFDHAQASAAAAQYLQANLRLDDNLEPLPDSLLRSGVIVEQFELIEGEIAFPFTYRNDAFDYEVKLYRPGVVMIVRLEYPRLFGVLPPVSWVLKGSAETVYA